ncbi:TIGR02710 family CRISPR-associated protein [candidate division WOR-3 bacterium]|nr:TIGR02710 family CRISPR-associated protein [candidate division WOR-3 bacterium]
MVDGKGKVVSVKPEKRCPKCNEIISKKELGRENIIIQSGYKNGYEIVEISDPDDFDEVYRKTDNTIKKTKQIGDEIIADFTGGTKTMSSVLAMLAALDFECKPSLTTGPRRDIIKVSGESIPFALDVSLPRVENMMQIIDNLISHYLYHPAELTLKRLTEEGFKKGLSDRIKKKLFLCKAFSYWDRFEYEKAFDILQNFAYEYNKEFNYLLKLLGKTANTGYEKVFDLVSNAERQACNGFYDNAVARLYRALELFAQIRLKTEYKISTSALEESLNKLKNKEKWKSKRDEKGKIKVGIKDDYAILLELDDEIGKVYESKEKELTDKLNYRNNSKLAHGDIPITLEEWEKFKKFYDKFIDLCCKNINLSLESIKLPKTFK